MISKYSNSYVKNCIYSFIYRLHKIRAELLLYVIHTNFLRQNTGWAKNGLYLKVCKSHMC